MDRDEDFRAALVVGRIATWEYNPATGLLSGASNLAQLYGAPDDPSTTMTLEQFGEYIHPDHREVVRARTEEAFRLGAAVDMEYPVLLPDGGTRWLQSRARPVHGPEGEVERWIGAVVDVTPLKRAEAEARAREQELQQALDAMPAIAVLAGPDGRVEYRNAYWRSKLAGHTEQQIAAAEVLHPDDREHTLRMFRESVESGEEFSDRFRIWDPDVRDYRWYVSRWRPLRGAEGEVTRWVGVAFDVHEQVTAEQALREANAVKDEFIGFVSHELRTPLTIVLGSGAFLRRRLDRLSPDEVRERLDDLHDAAQRLSDIVENMLTLAFADQGMETEPVSLVSIVERVCARHLERYPGQRLEFHAAAQHLPVRANPTWVEQVLANLLSNAAKYCPSDEPVEVLVKPADSEVQVRVLDRGPGIDPEEAERLFDAFYRTRTARERASGAGLGLAVCRRLMEVQGGRIWYRPRDGGGSEFGFALPLDRGDGDAA